MQQVQELKEEVMCILTSPVEKPSQKLNLIDVLQRLGVSYHFENEIEKTLQQLHRTLLDHDDQENDDDLYTIALHFDYLDNKVITFHVHKYLSIYQEDPSHDKVLHTFAKLDFNILQKMHQKELSGIVRWWKELNFSKKLPFIRDRVIECYFWILGVFFEPEYFLARRILTKVIAMTSTIDDIYDVYGTFEEIELFTEAIKRWDISAIDQLSEYMKVCYQALLDVYCEMEEIVGERRSDRVKYAIEAMKNQVRAYFDEAKWFHKKYIPRMDEYMEIALATSGYSLLATTLLVGMGDLVTDDSFKRCLANPKWLELAQ
ncbi:hypothetical protein ACB094_06G047800 [Castanea mollissima]